MTKCQICKTNEAAWALQYIGDPEPTFSRLGSHYRGFHVTKVCDDCRARASAMRSQILSDGQIRTRIEQDV